MTAPPIRSRSRRTAGAELADIFEQTMQQLTLLGHTLPRSASELTPQQLKILFTLEFLAVPTSMSRLSAKLGVTPGTLTRVAAGLRRKGYLERSRSADDDRVVNLRLTARGRKSVAQIKQYRQRFFADLCSEISPTDCRKLIDSHRYIFETYNRILRHKKGKTES